MPVGNAETYTAEARQFCPRLALQVVICSRSRKGQLKGVLLQPGEVSPQAWGSAPLGSGVLRQGRRGRKSKAPQKYSYGSQHQPLLFCTPHQWKTGITAPPKNAAFQNAAPCIFRMLYKQDQVTREFIHTPEKRQRLFSPGHLPCVQLGAPLVFLQNSHVCARKETLWVSPFRVR